MKPLRWKRSVEESVESHCGEWSIHPQYWGCVRARNYTLRRGKGYGTYVGTFDTQRQAKARAEEIHQAN